jgi:DNA polymerase-3 subunit delta
VNTSIVKGAEIDSNQLKDMCQVVPFMNLYRLIIVEGLLDLFEPEYRQRAGSKINQKRGEKRLDEWKLFADSIGDIPDSCILIFIDEKVTRNNRLFKILSPHATVKNFPLLREGALYSWIKNKVSESGASISMSALRLLVEYCSNDLWILSNEIDKLAAYCSDREISDGDVKELTCYSREANIFNLVDAIFDKKVGQTENILQKLMKEGTNTSYIITMIARQLRLIIKAKYLNNKANRKQALETLNLSSEYLLDKTISQAKKYSINQIKECYHRLLQADIDIKTGKYNEDVAIDLLVADLCRF